MLLENAARNAAGYRCIVDVGARLIQEISRQLSIEGDAGIGKGIELFDGADCFSRRDDLVAAAQRSPAQ